MARKKTALVRWKFTLRAVMIVAVLHTRADRPETSGGRAGWTSFLRRRERSDILSGLAYRIETPEYVHRDVKIGKE